MALMMKDAVKVDAFHNSDGVMKMMMLIVPVCVC